MNTIVAAALATLSSITLAQAQLELHGMKCTDGCLGPVNTTLVAENEVVQVLRMSIPGHSRTPMRDVTPRVVIWLNDAHFLDRYEDGKEIEEIRKPGDAEWVSARRHSGENLSDDPMEFIAVIIKGAARSEHRPPRGHEHR